MGGILGGFISMFFPKRKGSEVIVDSLESKASELQSKVEAAAAK